MLRLEEREEFAFLFWPQRKRGKKGETCYSHPSDKRSDKMARIIFPSSSHSKLNISFWAECTFLLTSLQGDHGGLAQTPDSGPMNQPYRP